MICLGLSGTNAETVRRASRVHWISFMQNEFSLIERGPEDRLPEHLDGAVTEFVCYSPLSRGMLGKTPSMMAGRAPCDYRSKLTSEERVRLDRIDLTRGIAAFRSPSLLDRPATRSLNRLDLSADSAVGTLHRP